MSEVKVDLSWDILSIILENRDDSLQPVLQILCSRQMANSRKTIRLALFDGRIVWRHCVIINNELSERFHDELLTPFTVIRIDKYQLTTNNDTVILLIENLSIIKNGDTINQKLVKNLKQSQEVPINFSIDPQMICPINAVTPFYRNWTIRAWVMNKSSIRSFNNHCSPGLDKRSVIDVIGVIHSVDNTRTMFLSQSQKVVFKRILTIVDDSKTKTILTLFENHAINFRGKPGQVIAVRGAVVIENQGKTLFTFASPRIEPDLPETDLLKKCYESLDEKQQQFISLYRSTDQKINPAIQFTSIGRFLQKTRLEKILYSNVRCRITSINRPEKHFYKSCIGCFKKLSENSQNYCIHCNVTFNKFTWRMILNIEISDWSDSVWVVIFHDQCEILLHQSVEELIQLYQKNPLHYRQLLIKELFFRTISVKILSRMESYEDEYRIRHIVVSILPDNKSLDESIKSIEFLKNNLS
ncbi:hypothetical protein BLA29_000154 [Euroglyphus maynei]|uniref:Uncharacterized protein n=1 Tax=Euroglyphus maynei TaxID=6958 RepID=A0A1Y3BSA6_EURMA|nr:hypothetical protein BLA29_000154 [Euroglyphus maynei]